MPATNQLDQPVSMGDTWVVAHLDRVEARCVRITLSIMTAPEAPIYGRDVAVHLVPMPSGTPDARDVQPDADVFDATCEPIEAPAAAHVLPMVQSKGATAFTRYAFARPDRCTSAVLQVTLHGHDASFAVPLAEG